MAFSKKRIRLLSLTNQKLNQMEIDLEVALIAQETCLLYLCISFKLSFQFLNITDAPSLCHLSELAVHVFIILNWEPLCALTLKA